MIFRKLVEAEEFLSLSSEEVINLISRGHINVPFEVKVCLIKFVIVVRNIFELYDSEILITGTCLGR